VMGVLGPNFTPLFFDVTDEYALARATDKVRVELKGKKLAGLVNNAGISKNAALLDIPIDDFRKVLEVNLIGPLRVTRAFAPLLGTDSSLSGSPGRIVNISSIAGKHAVPFAGAYTCSKHALEGLSETFRRELMLYGIDVVIVGPGAVKTSIWDRVAEDDLTPFQGSPYYSTLKKFNSEGVSNGRTNGHTPEQQGEAIYQALTVASPKTRYAVVAHRFRNWTLLNLLPPRMLDRMIAKRYGFFDAVRED